MLGLDRDADGRLTRDEFARWTLVARYPDLFDRLDANRDGVLTLAELEVADGAPRAEMRKALARLQTARNVRYATIEGVDPAHLSLDIYTAPPAPAPVPVATPATAPTTFPVAAPAASAARPVLVMLHGGGWRTGDKAGANVIYPKAPYFVDRGWVFVSVNHRLSPAVRHPAHVQDVAAALAWVHRNIADHGGDPSRIALMGHSSGAHLAALVATDERRLNAHGLDLGVIRAAVLLDSVAYDLPRLFDEFGRGSALHRAAFGESPEGLRDASPQYHVAAGKKIPPFLVYVTGRRTVPGAIGRRLVSTLEAAGIGATLERAADKTHASISADLGKPDDRVTRQVIEFLERETAPRATEIPQG